MVPFTNDNTTNVCSTFFYHISMILKDKKVLVSFIILNVFENEDKHKPVESTLASQVE